ncbi:MAG TPA: thymidine phosphorylase [Candidatus Saccharimonadales bacterium]|jgi:pyrimidine-nucleoside phosphorylase|nr:thymidine phosphorylase [Candidatus Saccharimonadales bacterium]
MRLVDLIRKKRDGGELSGPEIEFIVSGCTAGELPDYQLSAWLMAVLLKGMSRTETAALTQAMLHSGEVLDWREFTQKKVDKHSTGGVGDKTSLILTPIVAAGGLLVPMISGRGLGHTGGTLDKLESIPGFNVNLSSGEMRQVLATCGACMIGQTASICPADKKLYALRDVTGTVESPALICASIMGKKMAEGIDALVLDVKTGSGAFMKQEADAIHLAELMVETGERMGKKVIALITGMDQPLGRAVGNALEVIECIETLQGHGPEDLTELSLELAAWMFYLGERTVSVDAGRKLARELVANGAALRNFLQMTGLQGGNVQSLTDFSLLPTARHRMDVPSESSGYVTQIDCEKIGIASLVLGGGRSTKEDSINPAVGVIVHKKTGDKVSQGEPLCTLHYDDDRQLSEAKSLIESSYTVNATPPPARSPLMRKVIGAM